MADVEDGAAAPKPATPTLSQPQQQTQPRRIMVMAHPNAQPQHPGVSNSLYEKSGRYVTVGGGPAGSSSSQSLSPASVPPALTPEQIAAIERRREELEEADDLQHYAKQISLIFRPVLVCILLVVWWVKVEQQNILAMGSYSSLLFTNNVSTGEAISDGLINAFIIIGVVIVITIVFVILFVKGYIKFLYGYLLVATGLLLGGTGGLFLYLQCDALGVPLDIITLVFVCWNFALVGLVSVFWHTPLWLRQIYLVLVSALLAYSLTKIQEWTTWFLLGLLVIWDLVAVLTPCGPLRMLVESSQRQNQEIPALLYSVTMVFFMADAPADAKKKKKKSKKAAAGAVQLRDDDSDTGEADASKDVRLVSSESDDMPTPSASGTNVPLKPYSDDYRAKAPYPMNSQMSGMSTQGLLARSDSVAVASPPTPTQQQQQQAAQQAAQQQQEDDDDDDERNGIKLGLGDFVFYSVLVARAALSDWTTVVACICSVMTGLMSTIILLAMFKRALPALPISLVLGILFYFVTSLVITPFAVNNVSVLVHV